MIKLGGYAADPVRKQLAAGAGASHIAARDQGDGRLMASKGYELRVHAGRKLVQVHDAVLATARCRCGNQTVTPQQNVLVASVPATQSHHVLCAVLSRQDNAGEPLIRSGFYKLLRLGRAHNGDLVAKATGRAGDVQKHDLASAHVTVIGGDVEFFHRYTFLAC